MPIFLGSCAPPYSSFVLAHMERMIHRADLLQGDISRLAGGRWRASCLLIVAAIVGGAAGRRLGAVRGVGAGGVLGGRGSTGRIPAGLWGDGGEGWLRLGESWVALHKAPPYCIVSRDELNEIEFGWM